MQPVTTSSCTNEKNQQTDFKREKERLMDGWLKATLDGECDLSFEDIAYDLPKESLYIQSCIVMEKGILPPVEFKNSKWAVQAPAVMIASIVDRFEIYDLCCACCVNGLRCSENSHACLRIRTFFLQFKHVLNSTIPQFKHIFQFVPHSVQTSPSSPFGSNIPPIRPPVRPPLGSKHPQFKHTRCSHETNQTRLLQRAMLHIHENLFHILNEV